MEDRAKGIGRATAAEFARRGHRVIATARDPRTLAGLRVDRRLTLDVTDPDTIARAVREAGEIDVLVSNAGEIFYAAVEATPPAAFARLLDLNTIGALRVAQAVLPGMRARGRGRLLFVSSTAGRIVRPRQAAYAATKWALEALVEALVIEAGPLGIEAALSNRAPSAPVRLITSPPTPCPEIPTPTCAPRAAHVPAGSAAKIPAGMQAEVKDVNE